jgi:hypothetical protein
MSVGMPRPLSVTVTDSSAWMVTGDAVAIARQRLVDRVVDDLENHVMKARAVIGVADVHAGPFADGLEALQHLDFGGVVGVVLGVPGPACISRKSYQKNPAFCFVFQLLAVTPQKLKP